MKETQSYSDPAVAASILLFVCFQFLLTCRLAPSQQFPNTILSASFHPINPRTHNLELNNSRNY